MLAVSIVGCSSLDMAPTLSHKRHRKRAPIIAVLGFIGYFLHRLPTTRKIKPRREDVNRKPFLVDFVVRKKLKGGRWGKELKLTPHKSGRGTKKRWDLTMTIGQCKSVYLHRIVGLSVCPITTDIQGYEVDPYFATVADMRNYQVHHGNCEVSGTHDCRAQCLFPLWSKYHSTLARPRSS